MKGYGVFIQNDLFEPKHVIAMDRAYWLFSWLLDKVTSIAEDGTGKVLGGKPIKYDDVKKALGIDRKTYYRWVKRLRDNGYFTTKQTPQGLIISINKTKKVFNQRSTQSDSSLPKSVKSDVPHVTHHLGQSDSSDVPHVTHLYNRQYSKTIQRQDNDNITNVILSEKPPGAPLQYGRDDINQVKAYFLAQMRIPTEDCTQKQSRIYWAHLLRESRTGIEGVKWLIDMAVADAWFKNNITSSKDLYYKRVKIVQRKAGHINKFAIATMEGGVSENGQKKLENENIRGNSISDGKAEELLSSSNI